MKNLTTGLEASGTLASVGSNQGVPDVSLGVTVSPTGLPMGARKADINPAPILDALTKFTGGMLESDAQARAAQQKEADQRTKALQNLYNEKLGQDAATDLTTQIEALKADPERLAQTNIKEFASNIARQHEAKLGTDNLHAMQPLLGAYTSAIKDATKEQVQVQREAIEAAHFEDIQKNLSVPTQVTDPVTGQASIQLRLNPDVTPATLVAMVEQGQARTVPTAKTLKALTEAATAYAINGDTRMLDMMNVPVNKPGWDGLSLSMKAEAKDARWRNEMTSLYQKAANARQSAVEKEEERQRYMLMAEIDQQLEADPSSVRPQDFFKMGLPPATAYSYFNKALEAQAKAQKRSDLMALAQRGAISMVQEGDGITGEDKQRALDDAYAESSRVNGAFSDKHIDETLVLIQGNKRVPKAFAETVGSLSEDPKVDPNTNQVTKTFENSYKIYERAVRGSNPGVLENVFSPKDITIMRKVESLLQSGRAADLTQAAQIIKENSSPERLELNQKRMAAVQEDIIAGLAEEMDSSGWGGNSSKLGFIPSEMKNWKMLEGDARMLLPVYAELGITDPKQIREYLAKDLKAQYVDDGNNAWVKVPRGSTLSTTQFQATRAAGISLADRMGIKVKPEEIDFSLLPNGKYIMLAKGVPITRPDGKALSVSPATMDAVWQVQKRTGVSLPMNMGDGFAKDIATKIAKWRGADELNKKLGDVLVDTQSKADQAMTAQGPNSVPVSNKVTASQAERVNMALKSNNLTLGGLMTQEGFETKVYTDQSGHPTIGMGYNLDKSPQELERDFKDIGIMPDRMKKIIDGKEAMTEQEAMDLSQIAVSRTQKGISKLFKERGADWEHLHERHQAALTMLAYNTGPNSPLVKDAVDAVIAGDSKKFTATVNKVGYTDKDTGKFVVNKHLIDGITAVVGGATRLKTFVSYPKSDYQQPTQQPKGLMPALTPGARLPGLPQAKAN